METLLLLLAGGIGALAKDLVSDNSITLPSFQNGKYNLGFVGVMIVGAFVGYVIDNNPLMAGLSGYVGISVLNNILPQTSQKTESNPNDSNTTSPIK